MFPEPREQAKAIGVYSFVASAGASIGLLAGGALTEAINWHWIFFVNLPIGVATAVVAFRLLERDAGIGLKAGADVPGAVLDHGLADAGGVHDRRGGRAWLGLGDDARPRWRGRRDARRVPGARVTRADAADPAAHLPVAQRVGGERDPDADGRRPVRHLLPRGAVPPAGARLRRARRGARVPPRGRPDRRHVARGLAAAEPPLRRPRDARPRPRAGRRVAGAVHPHPGGRRVRDRHPALDGPDGRRRRPVLPRPDGPGDVGRDAERRRPRLGPREHDPAGRRRARPGRARHALDHAHRRAARLRRARPPRRSWTAISSRSWSAPGSWSPRSPSRWPSCARPSSGAPEEEPVEDPRFAGAEPGYAEAA